MKGTPPSLAKPAARKAAAMIPCNVQAPMRRAGRTDWMEAALILVSVVSEVESDEKLSRQPRWQQPIYFDDIHRPCRYIARAIKPERWKFWATDAITRSIGGAMLQRTHTCAGVNPPQVVTMVCRTQERWRSEFDRDAGLSRRFELAHLLP